jgi:hypothetical protein
MLYAVYRSAGTVARNEAIPDTESRISFNSLASYSTCGLLLLHDTYCDVGVVERHPVL